MCPLKKHGESIINDDAILFEKNIKKILSKFNHNNDYYIGQFKRIISNRIRVWFIYKFSFNFGKTKHNRNRFIGSFNKYLYRKRKLYVQK